MEPAIGMLTGWIYVLVERGSCAVGVWLMPSPRGFHSVGVVGQDDLLDATSVYRKLYRGGAMVQDTPATLSR